MAFKYSTGFVKKVIEQIAVDINGFQIDIYSGIQPSSPDVKITISSSVKLLGTIKTSGGSALNFATTSTDGVIDKPTGEAWQFTGLDNGTASWLRIHPVSDIGTDASDTQLRIDGSFGYGSADATIEGSGNTIESGKIYTVNQCALHWGA